MSHKLSVVFFVCALGAVTPLLPSEAFKQVEVSNTDRVNFGPGGLIRLDNSYGDVTVEGWDRPLVEVTIIKSMPFDYRPKHPELGPQQMERVSVGIDRRSDTELAIGTTLPTRKKRYVILPAKVTNGVMLEYQVHVPRYSRLAIHHGVGSVTVSDVTGDIDASVGRGDIMLWLSPGSFSQGLYSIDAKVKFGHVTSELDGAHVSQYLIGQHFTRVNPPSPAHRLVLRMGYGGITILGNKAESEATKEDAQ